MNFLIGDVEGMVKMPRLRTASGRAGGGARVAPISGPACIVPNGVIAMNPLFIADFGLAISTDVGTNRLLATNTPDGINGELDFINTATNAVINAVVTAFVPDAPAYAASNQTFWVPKLDGINNDRLRKYDKDGNFVIEIAPSLGNAVGTHICYEPNTARLYGCPFDPVDAIIWDVNPATNAITLHTIAAAVGNTGPSMMFAAPGVVFVNQFTPDYDVNIFNAYSVPGFALIGKIDMSTIGNWDGSYAYSSVTGKAYFGVFTGGKIIEVTPAAATIDFTYTITDRAMSLLADNFASRLIANDTVTGNGTVIDPVSRSVICKPILSTSAGPFNMAADPNVGGRIYLSDLPNKQLAIYI